MKKVIWKFVLSEEGNQIIELPLDYEILALQTQQGNPCIWVLVDPTRPKKTEVFEIYGTGHEIHYSMGMNREYVGTWQEQEGMFVCHLFKYTIN